jgi:hypothetical protein
LFKLEKNLIKGTMWVMMIDERNMKSGNVEIPRRKLLSRKDYSVWQVILKHSKSLSKDIFLQKACEYKCVKSENF